MAYAYSGVWRSGSGPYYLWANADWNGFAAKWQALSQQNLRLVALDTYQGGGGVRLWSGVWEGGSDAHYLWVNADWNNFVAKWQQLASQNLRLTTMRTYLSGNTRLWAGVSRIGTTSARSGRSSPSRAFASWTSKPTCPGARSSGPEPGGPALTLTTCG